MTWTVTEFVVKLPAKNAAASTQKTAVREATRRNPADDGRERRLVEYGRHRQAHEDPHAVQREQRVRRRPEHDEGGGQDRADRHQRASAAAVDPAADGQTSQRGDGQAGRERAGDLGARESQLGLHRAEHHREAVIDDAPRDRLGDAEARHHRPAVVESAWAWHRRARLCGPAMRGQAIARRYWGVSGVPKTLVDPGDVVPNTLVVPLVVVPE